MGYYNRFCDPLCFTMVALPVAIMHIYEVHNLISATSKNFLYKEQGS